MRASAVPFDGSPPAVHDGDAVEIRDIDGNWHRTTAKSAPRYDYGSALGRRCWLTVAVVVPNQDIVNWPADAVRPAEPMKDGAE